MPRRAVSRSAQSGIQGPRTLVFLDVKNGPVTDGFFGVIEEVGPERMPVTVFVTRRSTKISR